MVSNNSYFRMLFSIFALECPLADLCPCSTCLSRVLGLENLIQLFKSPSLCLNLQGEGGGQRAPISEARELTYKEEVNEDKLEKVPEDEKDIKPVPDLWLGLAATGRIFVE